MKKPHAIIFSGYGLNTEDETKVAFEMAGGTAEILHINDVIARPAVLNKAQIAIIPGGFSYGDDTGGGKAYGNKLKKALGDTLQKFLDRDTLLAGICNGFQIITSAGIIPGALIANDNARYTCRWVDVQAHNNSPWLEGIEQLSLPIAHGEGKYYASDELLGWLNASNSVALRYVKGEIAEHFDMPYNPNGALEDIAGITGYNGRVLGLMPHPERAIFFSHQPHWTSLQESYVRAGLAIPKEGPGLQLFKNAVKYFA